MTSIELTTIITILVLSFFLLVDVEAFMLHPKTGMASDLSSSNHLRHRHHQDTFIRRQRSIKLTVNSNDDDPIQDLITTTTTNKKQKRSGGGGGGRAPGQVDKISDTLDGWYATPCDPQEARLTVIQITDVYTLEHLASVKTLVEDTRAKSIGSKVICMITVS
jgi:hypothetical protein